MLSAQWKTTYRARGPKGSATGGCSRRAGRARPAGASGERTAGDQVALESSSGPPEDSRYQPRIIDRTLFQKPVTRTMKRWTAVNAMSPRVRRKCRVLADWRPPNAAGRAGTAASTRGDMARPVSTSKGAATKMIDTYESFWRTL